MKGIPAVPNVQTATRVSPKVWRCTTCGRLNDTRKADQRCGHVPPWVEADRQQEADLARFRTLEQTRMADRWHRDRQAALRGHIRLTPDLVAQIRAATGTHEEVAKRFAVSRTTVRNIRRDPTHGAKSRVWTEEEKAKVRAMAGSVTDIANRLGVSRTTIGKIRQQAKQSAPGR